MVFNVCFLEEKSDLLRMLVRGNMSLSKARFPVGLWVTLLLEIALFRIN